MTTARSARKWRGVGNAARVVVGGVGMGSSLSNGRTRETLHLGRGTCWGKGRIDPTRRGTRDTRRGEPGTTRRSGKREQRGGVKRLRENRCCCFHPRVGPSR